MGKNTIYNDESSMRTLSLTVYAEQLGLASDASSLEMNEVLSDAILNIDPNRYFVFAIVHYKDFIINDKGEKVPKKVHAHIWLIVRHGGPAKIRTLLNLLKVSFRPDIDDNFKAHAIKNIKNKAVSAMYATHETAKALADPNKKKYLTDDVITNDLEYYLYLRKQYKTEELSKEDINQILLAVANDGMTEREAMQAIGPASITIGQINKIKAKRLYYMQVTNPAPLEREMEVFWHCGASNSGKTYYIKKILPNEFGRENVYRLDDRDFVRAQNQ
ncbi:MAG: replication protein [Lachnospiraceae bacterium]|nr:replication protein [Lachnospiraceae bacterium]